MQQTRDESSGDDGSYHTPDPSPSASFFRDGTPHPVFFFFSSSSFCKHIILVFIVVRIF